MDGRVFFEWCSVSIKTGNAELEKLNYGIMAIEKGNPLLNSCIKRRSMWSK